MSIVTGHRVMEGHSLEFDDDTFDVAASQNGVSLFPDPGRGLSVTWGMEFRSARHMWDVVTTSNPIGAQLVADLTEEQKSAVGQVLEGLLRERSGGFPGATLNTDMNIAIGTT